MKRSGEKEKWDIKAGLKTRAFRVGGYSIAMTAVVLAIVVLVNVIAGALPATWTQFDTTANQLLSFSDQTQKIVKALDTQVTFYWIVQSGKENMETADLSLLTLEAVPEDADCIIICAPSTDLAQEEVDMLTSYLQSGGNLFLITDPPQAGAELPTLNAMMASYGVTAEEGIVVEGNSAYYAFGTAYYLLPELASHTVTDPLYDAGYRVLLPIASGLTVGSTPSGVVATKLLTTSGSAFSKLAGYSLSTYEKEEGDIDGPFSLAVAVSDYNTGGKIVWVSSAALVDESCNSRVSGGNLDFFLNSLGWMCEQEESISIHAKSLEYEYLTIDSSTVTLLTMLVLIVLPVGYLAVGIVIWIRRKRR